MLYKTQIQVTFLFEFKMGCKAAEATWNINNASGPGTAQVQCSGGSSFAKETRALKMRRLVAGHQEADNNQLRAWLKLILLEQHKKLLKNSTSTILRSFSIWSKLERWKSLVSGCLMTWLKIKKVINLKYHLFLFYTTTTNHFLIGLWCAMKIDFIRQPATTSSVAGLRRISKALSQSQTCPQQKVMVTVCGLLPGWSTTAFWILEKPIHLRSMLSKSMRHTKNCKACSHH